MDDDDQYPLEFLAEISFAEFKFHMEANLAQLLEAYRKQQANYRNIINQYAIPDQIMRFYMCSDGSFMYNSEPAPNPPEEMGAEPLELDLI